jgi:hypothetical protein
MPSRSISRQEFLVLSITVGTAAFVGCSDDPASPPATGGTGNGTGGGGSGTTGGGGSGGSATGGGGTTGGGGSGTTGGGGSGGSATGGGGAGGSGGGGAGGGGAGGGGAGGGGAGGGGAGGGGAGGGGGMCGTADILHTSNMGHTHIEMKAMVVASLKTHINGATPTADFILPNAGNPQPDGHPHTLKFTANEIAMLKGGGTITGKMSEQDDTGHRHTYTISCVA